MNAGTAATEPAPAGWFLKLPDQTVYGPVPLGTLREWAADRRIAPGYEISTDRAEWRLASSLPELNMAWLVEQADGTSYGPLHINAVLEFIREGKVGAADRMRHAATGETGTALEILARLYVAAVSPVAPAAAAGPADDTELRREVEAQQARAAELEQRMARLAGEGDTRLQELEARGRELLRLQEELAARDAQWGQRLEDLNRLVAAGRTAQTEAEQERAAEAARRAGAERDRETLRHDAEDLRRQVQELAQEREAVGAELAADRARNAALLKSLQQHEAELLTQVAALAGEKDEAAKRLEGAQNRIQALEQQLREMAEQSARKAADWERQSGDWAQQLAAQRTATEQASAETTRLKAEAETLGARLAQADTYIQSSRTDNDRMRVESVTLTRRLAEEQAGHERTRVRAAETENQLAVKLRKLEETCAQAMAETEQARVTVGQHEERLRAAEKEWRTQEDLLKKRLKRLYKDHAVGAPPARRGPEPKPEPAAPPEPEPINWLDPSPRRGVRAEEPAAAAPSQDEELRNRIRRQQIELTEADAVMEDLRRELDERKQAYEDLRRETEGRDQRLREQVARLEKDKEDATQLIERAMEEVEQREAQVRLLNRRFEARVAADAAAGAATGKTLDADAWESGGERGAAGAQSAGGRGPQSRPEPDGARASRNQTDVLAGLEAQAQAELREWRRKQEQQEDSPLARMKSWLRRKSTP